MKNYIRLLLISFIFLALLIVTYNKVDFILSCIFSLFTGIFLGSGLRALIENK